MNRRKSWIGTAVLALVGVLWIPERPARLPEGAGQIPFVWDQDAFWSRLESRFVDARDQGCEAVRPEVSDRFGAVDEALGALADPLPQPGDARFARLETHLFALAPLVGACTEHVGELLAHTTRLRATVKEASRGWDVTSRPARDQVYRLLYGSRAAVEEVLLQLPRGTVPDMVLATDEPSATPSTEVRGLRVHSGDVLVSRGGAPTSALIARGNDYPGNFSHIALVHVDETNREVTVVESHIEEGVVLSSLERYLSDTKLRIMVLRPRADLTALVADPSLPHRAATRTLEEVRARRIPYDFQMNYKDPSKQFCSEVASAAYAGVGIGLWEGLTSMSSRGVTSWLAALGVRHFETHGPSDLEYDPKLRVVAEWRDPETLFQDHVDNAVIDALLEGAEEGEKLEYSRVLLPLGRLKKLHSAARNLAGRRGPIPRGMSATTALRVHWLGQRHAAIKTRVLELVEAFSHQHGYNAPYWELVRLARQAKAEIDRS